MITSYDEAVHRLRAVPGLSVCARPVNVLPLLRAGCLAVLLGTEAADAGWAGEFGTEFHALEAATAVRDHGGTGPAIQAVLRGLTGSRSWQGRELAVMPYQTTKPVWITALEELGTRLVTPRSRPRLPVLTDKIDQRAWLRSVGASTPADTVTGVLDHQRLRRLFGDTYVVQTPQGSGGRGTHLVTGEEDLRAIGGSAGPWLVSRYSEGTPVNVHGLVSADGTASLLRTSVQLTRVDGVGAPFGSYSGCDFGAPALLPPRALALAGDTVLRIGTELAGLGYRGLFGADFVIDGEEPLLLELNGRMQESTWLLGDLELAEGSLPSALRHVLELYGRPTSAEPSLDPSDGSQLVVRHTGGPVRVTAAPVGGLHRLKDGRLRRTGVGFGLLECGQDDCVLLQLPAVGTLLHPGVPIGRLVARHSLTAPDGSTLTARGRELVDALRAGFAFEPAELPGPAEPC